MNVSEDSTHFQLKEQCVLTNVSYTNIGLRVKVKLVFNVSLYSGSMGHCRTRTW